MEGREFQFFNLLSNRVPVGLMDASYWVYIIYLPVVSFIPGLMADVLLPTAVEKLAVDTSFLLPVNGVNQYLEIKGVSRRKPVLLFIHGGPSWPATPMNRKYNEDLSKILSWCRGTKEVA